VLVDYVYVSPERGVRATRHPDTPYRSFDNPPVEETFDAFTVVFTIDAERRPLFPRFDTVYYVRLLGVDPKDSRRPRSLVSEAITLHLLLDVELDPLRHGFRIIFQPAHRYRLRATVKLDPQKPESEPKKGRFKRAWR
jgi:hypothetical protein